MACLLKGILCSGGSGTGVTASALYEKPAQYVAHSRGPQYSFVRRPAAFALVAFRKELTTTASMPYATGSLAKALLKRNGVKPPYFQDPFTTVLSPIMVMISWVYHLPIQHRKALLDACRIQAPIWKNSTLSISFAQLEPVFIFPEHSSGEGVVIIYPSHLASYFENIWPFPLLCSLLSYFVRAEGTIHKEQFLEEKAKSLDKELAAALHYESIPQRLDYSGLFGVTQTHLHPQLPGRIGWRLTQLFQSGVQHIAQRFSSISTRPLFPSYNSRKNVSYSTCRAYYEAVGDSTVDDCPTDVTTLDLLKLYYHTGTEVSGVIEMRQAWFFNDLKPRTYYCLGGNDFFHGMYIQEVANLFCNILPSTNPFTRFAVSRIGSLSYDELLITYDYSSFTTSLAELKYFMFWLAEYCPDVVLPCLDVFHGVRDVSLRAILRSYNTAVNHHQMFSLERFQQAEESILLRQGRSGSLGVKGNIVFSTTLHGLALADITGTPDDDCCVGDDALARIRAWYITIFITCVNNLGDINPTKFTTITPIPPDTEISRLTEQFKFLKRPLTLDDDNRPSLGVLDFFPSIADVLFPSGDGIHTTTPGSSAFASARTFAMQVGRYFRNNCTGESASIIATEDDLDFILGGFQEAYRKLGLPLEGGVPGDFAVKVSDGYSRDADFYCPPVDSRVCFDTPWMELLLDRFYGRKVTVPLTVGGTIPPPLKASVGQKFHASSDVKILTLGVDLGFLERRVETTWQFFDHDVAWRIWEKMLKGGKNLEPLYSEYEVIGPLPDWWFDVVSLDYPVLLEEDPLEAWERISSVMSGSTI